MVITYLGLEFFKVQFGDMVLAFNPISKESTHKGSRFGADIVFVTLAHPDMSGVEQVSFGEKKPFVIEGPGEYEIQGILVRGVPSESRYGGTPRRNTIYHVTLEGMKLCFLGAVSSSALSAEAKEKLGDVDLLFAPIGGGGVCGPAEAYKLALSLEPRLIIPMYFGDVGEKNALKTFLKESGEEGVRPEEKLTLKRKDLEGKEAAVVVLNPSA